MPDNKFIITRVTKTSDDDRVYTGLRIDSSYTNQRYVYKPGYVYKPEMMTKTGKFSVGDVLEYVDGNYVHNKYYDCYPAIVLSTDMINGEDISKSYKLVYVFSKEFGDIRISLTTTSPFFYTKRGDELMLRKNENDNKIEIATNKTVDEMRAKFLQNQKQK